MTTNNTVVTARLVENCEELEATVGPTTVEAAASDDHERIRDKIKLKVGIEAINFALAHRPTGIPNGSQT